MTMPNSLPSFNPSLSYRTRNSSRAPTAPTMNRRLTRSLEDNASTNLFRGVNFFKRFAIKFMDMKKFRPGNQPFIDLPNSNANFQYEGSPMQHVGKDKMASIHRFVERLHRQENTDELHGKTHDYALLKGGGIGSMKLHVTFISKKDGQLSFRRKYVDIRSQSGKVGFMPEKQHRQEAYSILFPNNMINGTLQANSHQKNLCAWAIPSSDYKTVYMISHNVLFNGPCVPDSKNMNHYRMTREAPVLLAFLGVKIHGYGSTREARLLRFVLKSASNRGSIVKSKIIMAKPKLRALVGNHVANATPNHNNYHKALVIHSMYSNAQKTQKQRAQAQRNKRKRNRNNGNKAGPSRRPRQ